MAPSVSLLRLLALFCLLLGAANRRSLTSAGLIAIGLILFLISSRLDLPRANGFEVRIAAVASAVLISGVVAPPFAVFPPSLVGLRPVLLATGFATCCVGFLLGHRPRGRYATAFLALFVVVLTVGSFVAHEWNARLGSDIYNAHRLAGHALLSGENPYTDVVQLSDGNPFAPPERMIIGYPYPPVVLITYGFSGAFTDPRMISVVSLLAFLGWLAWSAVRTPSGELSNARLSVLMLMALSPLSPEVVFMAWTEPLTLLLFLLTAIIWNRSATWSGVLLGLAVASKQYLVFLAPLLLLHRDQMLRRRSLSALITAAATIVIGLTPNPRAFIQATIGNLADIDFRPDTQSLPGLAAELGFDLLLPNAIWIVLALTATTLLALSSRTCSGFIIRSGLALGVAFLLGMAFPNYWFLVAALLGLGSVLEVEEAVAVVPLEATIT